MEIEFCILKISHSYLIKQSKISWPNKIFISNLIKINRIVDYEPVHTSKILSESTVK